MAVAADSPLRDRLSGPSGVGCKALPVSVVHLKELIGFAIGHDFLNLRQIPGKGIFKHYALPTEQRHHLFCGIDPFLLMKYIPVIRAFRSTDVLKELGPRRRLLEREPLPKVHIPDFAEFLEEIPEHGVLPVMLIRDVMDRMLEGNQGMSFPARPRCPMKDHSVLRPVRLRAAHLLYLMLDNLVGPYQIKK